MNLSPSEITTHITQTLSHLPASLSSPSPSTRCHLTLTYAQTLNGHLSGPNKSPYKISSPESFIMTHTLRVVHDAIAVGIGTLINDNPGLKVKFVTESEVLDPFVREKRTVHPRVVVLDPLLKCSGNERALNDFGGLHGRDSPIILTLESSIKSQSAKLATLKSQGIEIIPIPSHPIHSTRLDFSKITAMLYTHYGIRSLMVEGGVGVIEDLLMCWKKEVDWVVVTIAPVVIKGGCGVFPPVKSRNSSGSDNGKDTDMDIRGSNDAAVCVLRDVRYGVFGGDVVMFGRVG